MRTLTVSSLRPLSRFSWGFMECSEIQPRMVAASSMARAGSQTQGALRQLSLSSKSGDMQAPSLRYIESIDPADAVQEGTHFMLTPEEIPVLFPEGLPSSLNRHFDFAKGSKAGKLALMHRNASKRIITELTHIQNGEEVKMRGFYLTGPRGIGKSASLLHTVLWARNAGWIVLYIPSVRALMQKGVYCYPATSDAALKMVEDVSKNTTKEKLKTKGKGPSERVSAHIGDGRIGSPFHMPINAQKILSSLVAIHGDQLEELPVSVPAVLERRGPMASTLLDIIKPGLPVADRQKNEDAFEVSEANADLCLVDLLEELMSTDKANVLIAIDEYNEFYQPSGWYWGEERRISPQEFSILKPLMAFPELHSSKVPKRGAVIAANTSAYPVTKTLDKKTWKGWREHVGRRISSSKVAVHPYTEAEFNAACEHYRICMGDDQRKPTEADLLMVKAKTELIPKMVFHRLTHTPFG